MNEVERKIHTIFSRLDNSCTTEGATFSWSATNIGFGTFTFYLGEDGYLHCDNEAMSRKFIKKMLERMVDDAIMDDPSQWDSAVSFSRN